MTTLGRTIVKNSLSLLGRFTILKNLAWWWVFSDKKVLVIGCSTGNNECRRFVELGAREVHGVDIAEEIGLEFVHPRVKYYRMSAESLNLESDQYDIAYCQATLEHVPQIELALAEAIRVTKRGGYIYCVASPLWHSMHGHHQGHIFGHFPWIHLRLSEDEIKEYCRLTDTRDPIGSVVGEATISYMLNEKYFNKLHGGEYVEACKKLTNVRVFYNQLEMSDDKELTSGIFSELRRKGFTREELLATTHRFIARKTD